jgi:hypothetical protein
MGKFFFAPFLFLYFTLLPYLCKPPERLRSDPGTMADSVFEGAFYFFHKMGSNPPGRLRSDLGTMADPAYPHFHVFFDVFFARFPVYSQPF